MHLSVFTTFYSPNIWVCPPNIFDKFTPVSSRDLEQVPCSAHMLWNTTASAPSVKPTSELYKEIHIKLQWLLYCIRLDYILRAHWGRQTQLIGAGRHIGYKEVRGWGRRSNLIAVRSKEWFLSNFFLHQRCISLDDSEFKTRFSASFIV